VPLAFSLAESTPRLAWPRRGDVPISSVLGPVSSAAPDDNAEKLSAAAAHSRYGALMGIVYRSRVPEPVASVFAWHERPGALQRLSPPWLPVKLVQESPSLRDGQAVLHLPGGLRWVAHHQPSGYNPPHSFVDELASLPIGWHHTHVFSEDGEATVVEDRVDTPVPASLLRQVFTYRHRQLAEDLASQRTFSGEPLTIAVTGSSGLIGSALTAFLTTAGHHVIRLVRREPLSDDERHWVPLAPGPDLLDGTDVVVHLAGAPIGGRFSDRHKQALRDSRVAPTRALAEAAAQAATGKAGPSVFVSASAVGYYGFDRSDERLAENSARGEGFLAQLVADWEAATAPATEAGLRVVQLRTGLVLSPRGGLLGLLYPVYLAGMGGRLGSGQQWLPWVGIDDMVDIYYRALRDPNLAGPVNAVAPVPVTNAELTATLARVLRRLALLAVPEAAARLALGPEGARELALASQRVEPAVLSRAGHRYRYPELEPALRHLLGREKAHPNQP